MDSFKSLVSFSCVARIHRISSQQAKDHRCRFSLGTINNEPCIQLDGEGISSRKQRFNAFNLKTVAVNRIDEGRLSISFIHLEWRTVFLMEVKEFHNLRRCVELLNDISSGKFNPGRSVDVQQVPLSTPPSTRDVPLRSPLTTSRSGSERRKVQLMRHPNNWRGATMVAAAQSQGALTSGFYKTPISEPFLPRRLESPYSGYFSKARRTLNLVNENTDTEDLQPTLYTSMQSSTPRRTPLTDLLHNPGAISPPIRTDGVEGFANLGNTCYMNAVLQSILGLECFAEDVLNHQLVKQVHPKSLYRMMFLLLKSKRAKDSYESQRILLKRIKESVSDRAVKFLGYRQQDAHEFLNQCLDQLKDDVDHLNNHKQCLEQVQEVLCPVKRNFECEIIHTISCKSCDRVTSKAEEIFDFALQLPRSIHHNPNEQANLQLLFDSYFLAEDVDYTCTSCQGKAATLTHKLSRLPRVIVLHLKRYGYNVELSKNSKRIDNIRIPRIITIGHLRAENSTLPVEFTGPWPRDLSTLSAMAADSENKENVLREHTNQITVPNEDCIEKDSVTPVINTNDISEIHQTKSRSPQASNANPMQNSGDIVIIPDDDECEDVTVKLGKRKLPESLTHEFDSDLSSNKRAAKCVQDTNKVIMSNSTTDDEFDSIAKEVVFDFDTKPLLSDCQLAQCGVLTPPTLNTPTQSAVESNFQSNQTSLNQEDADFQRAMEESMKEQPNDFQLLHQLGMSEEDQLKLALELSMQESTMEASVDQQLSPTPCVKDGVVKPVTPEPDSQETYRLVSVVSHIGRGSGGGHYISDVYSVADRMWKTYNDSYVNEVKEEDVRQRRQTSGYIFFYLHRSTLSNIAKHFRH